jgi:hypothetical protein
VGSSEWRYGQADGDRPWVGGEAKDDQVNDPTPNLWIEDPTNAWGAEPSWEPLPPRAERPESDPWLRPPTALTPAPTLTPPLPAPTAPRSATSSALTGTTTPQPVPQWGQPRHGTFDATDGGRARRTATLTRPRRPVGQPRGANDDQPTRRSVLSFTAAWYGLPGVFYLVWLMTLDGDRQSLAWRGLVTNFPWLLSSVVLSLAVGWFLCTTVVGWRVLTISFAASVIGAGLITVAHSSVL